jgi:hypothetical protein
MTGQNFEDNLMEMKKFFKFFAKAMAVFVLAIVGLFFGLRYWMSHPSDESLIKNFEKNQSAFNELVGMIREDKELERVDDNWTRPDSPASIGISSERIAKYRQIFNELKIPRGFYSFMNPTRIEFIASASGLSVSGSSKGYAFLENKPDLVVEDLDNYHSPDGRSFTAYRQLSGNWYLVYDFED